MRSWYLKICPLKNWEVFLCMAYVFINYDIKVSNLDGWCIMKCLNFQEYDGVHTWVRTYHQCGSEYLLYLAPNRICSRFRKDFDSKKHSIKCIVSKFFFLFFYQSFLSTRYLIHNPQTILRKIALIFSKSSLEIVNFSSWIMVLRSHSSAFSSLLPMHASTYEILNGIIKTPSHYPALHLLWNMRGLNPNGIILCETCKVLNQINIGEIDARLHHILLLLLIITEEYPIPKQNHMGEPSKPVHQQCNYRMVSLKYMDMRLSIMVRL